MSDATPVARAAARAAAALLLATGGVATAAQAATSADTIYTNARVYTVDAKRPWAEAVAVAGDKIVAVGSKAQVAALKGNATRIVDLGGRLMLPAFGDAHNHPMFGGLSGSRCPLHAGKTVDDYRAIIAKCVAETPGDGTVFGVGWEDSLFPPDGVPRKEVLDSISTSRPLIFQSVGGHTYWVNSKTLAVAKITKDTAAPTNGVIDRDPKTGEPVGSLQESAMDMVEHLIPAPTPREIQDSVIYVAGFFNSLGIVSWNDAGVTFDDQGGVPMVDAYRAVKDAGKLTAYVSVSLKWRNEQGMEQLPALLKAAERSNAAGVPTHTVKFYVDGVIPQNTAYMIAPYEKGTGRGSPQISPEILKQATIAIDAKGMQGFYHTIGDGAARMSLDAIEAARKANGKKPTHHMLTHLNVVDPVDQARFGKLGVYAQIQPTWSSWYPYMELIETQIGKRRMAYVHPGRGFIRGGAKLAYGADWPVATANPLEGLEVAMTRRTAGDPNARPLNADEGVTLAQAIESHTLNVAEVNGFAAITGSITPGKNADLVVLDKDIFKLPTYEISKAKVLLTIFKGKPVYGDPEKLAP